MSGFSSTLSRSLGPSALGVASREMEDLFDRLFDPNGNGHSQQWRPPISVWEESKYYHLEMDLPGIRHEDIDVSFEQGRLKISAKRAACDEPGKRKYLHDERCWGAFSRSIAIPDTVDAESIEASFHDGVLHVQLAKRPELMPKMIEITTK